MIVKFILVMTIKTKKENGIRDYTESTRKHTKKIDEQTFKSSFAFTFVGTCLRLYRRNSPKIDPVGLTTRSSPMIRTIHDGSRGTLPVPFSVHSCQTPCIPVK